jgi:hypothetical protein
MKARYPQGTLSLAFSEGKVVGIEYGGGTSVFRYSIISKGFFGFIPL